MTETKQTKPKEEKSENNVVVSEKKDVEKSETAEILSSLPDDMPAEMKKQVVSMMMGFNQTTVGRSGARHPLFEKFSDEHVHKYLDYIQRDDDNAHELKSTNRWFHLAYVIIGVAFFGFLIVYLLPKDKTLLNDILKLLFTFAGGVGSGYGIRSYLEKK